MSPAPQPESARPASARQTRTVLVIDDNEAFREIAAAWLQDRYLVLTAADALNGLAIALRARPDVILLDLMMPSVSGLELLQAIEHNEKLRATPVVIVTVYPVRHDAEAARALRPRIVIEKPVDRLALLRCVEAALGEPPVA